MNSRANESSPRPEAKSGASLRLPALDVLRFIAAAAVVTYHLTYSHAGNTSFGSLPSITKYGYLGVNLFFMISGFVIVWSAAGRTVSAYLISRAARLYPSFWLAIITTSMFLLLLHPERAQPAASIIANFTMMPGYFHADYVDGVYWTLAIELKFYFLVLICLLLRQMSNIEMILRGWLLLTAMCYLPHAPHALASLTIFPFGSFFVAGATFYLRWRDGATPARSATLLACIPLTCVAALNDRSGFMSVVTDESTYVTVGFIITSFAVFTAIARGVFASLSSRLCFQLGSVTYPLYLLHNEIGRAVFSALTTNINPWFRLFITLIVVGGLSWFMAVTIEQRASPLIRRAMTRWFARWQRQNI